VVNREFKIGGEFEIDPQIFEDINFESYKNDQFLFSNGRSALMAIMKFAASMNSSVIYIPYYICESVVFACQKSGFKIEFYELTSEFSFPIEKINEIEINATILTVNYFGFINDAKIIKQIKAIRPDVITISDQVQSLWTYQSTGANIYKNAEKQLDDDISISKASLLSHYLYDTIDLESIKERRRKNYKLIYELGKIINLNFIFPYDKNVIPLCVPITIKNRDVIRKELRKRNIFLPIHWPLSSFNSNIKSVKNLAENELTLVVDQRYSDLEINYQINNLKKLML